jgi:hypothetical protein
VLMIMFGPKREKLTGGFRILQYEEFHSLYSSQNISARCEVITAVFWVASYHNSRRRHNPDDVDSDYQND